MSCDIIIEARTNVARAQNAQVLIHRRFHPRRTRNRIELIWSVNKRVWWQIYDIRLFLTTLKTPFDAGRCLPNRAHLCPAKPSEIPHYCIEAMIRSSVSSLVGRWSLELDARRSNIAVHSIMVQCSFVVSHSLLAFPENIFLNVV